MVFEYPTDRVNQLLPGKFLEVSNVIAENRIRAATINIESDKSSNLPPQPMRDRFDMNKRKLVSASTKTFLVFCQMGRTEPNKI